MKHGAKRSPGKMLCSLLLTFALSLQLVSPALADESTATAAAVTPEVKAGYSQVKLSWTSAGSDATYSIYRLQGTPSAAGGSTDVYTAVSEGQTDTTYTDTAVTVGNTYTYRVDTITSDGTTTAGTPVSTDKPVGLESLKQSATLSYIPTGDDKKFDGTKTVELDGKVGALTALTQGSIVVRARYTGTDSSKMTLLIGLGNNPVDNTRLAAVGVTGNKMRYELCNVNGTGGLYSSAASAINWSDGQWHTVVLTAGNALLNVSADGASGTTGADGHYEDAKWNGFLNRTQNANSLTIGGIRGVTANTADKTYANWVGEIDYVLVTDEVISVANANALTEIEGPAVTTLSNRVIAVSADGMLPSGSTIGTIGTVGTPTNSVTLAAGEGNNRSFILDGTTLKTSGELTVGSYTVVFAPLTADGKSTTFTIYVTHPLTDAVTTLSTPAFLPNAGQTLPAVQAETATKLASSPNLTVLAQVASDKLGYNTIFSLSNVSSSPSSGFLALYANGKGLRWQLSGLPGATLNINADALRGGGLNTVALKFDISDYTVKMFANGALVNTQQYSADTFPLIPAVANLDTATIGGHMSSPTKLESPFSGLISELSVYGRALSDAEIIDYTAKTPATIPTPPSKALDENDQPFLSNDDFNSQQFRIPALYTLQDGRVLAASDIRFGSYSDSPNNLDTGIRFKENGIWGPAQMVNHFVDYADRKEYEYFSASFIDPTIVQTDTGRIIMMVDAFPGGAGLFGRYGYGTGFHKLDGEYYLGLTNSTRTLVHDKTDYYKWNEFEHYLKLNPTPSADGHDKYLILRMSDNGATEYTTDGQFNLYQNGTPLTIRQGWDETSNVLVPMNIFYTKSIFKVFSTSYLWFVYSDDGGKTWSDPILGGNQERHQAEYFLGAGPGRGHVVQNGPYKGRILFCVYDENMQAGVNKTVAELASTVYSDDNGLTWHNGGRTSMATEHSPGKSSEAQIVEFPDGTLRMYARSVGSYIGYCDSTDGGQTWTPMVRDYDLRYNGGAANGCEISVINYSQLIDGKPALILSSPDGATDRVDGVIRIGLISGTPGNYSVDWKYRYNVNYGNFGYSSLTELSGGGIALLSEGNNRMEYREFTLAELMTPNTAFSRFAVTSTNLQPGSPITVTMDLPYASIVTLTNLDHLNISYPGTALASGKLALQSTSADGKTLTFTGTLSSESYEITVPTDQHIVSLKGIVAPTSFDRLVGTIGSGGGGGDGGGSGTTTKPDSSTTTNPDGSTTTTVTDKATGTVTETTKYPDGTTAVVETKKDGTITETVQTKSGVQTKSVTTPDGKTAINVTLPTGTDASVTLPNSPVIPGKDGSAPTITIKAPDTVKQVIIPVKNAGPGTVAIVVKPDGTTQILPKSALVDGGLSVPLSGGVTIQIVDNAKSFGDVPASAWFGDAVAFASGHGLFAGTGTGTFSPNEPTTRAMVWTVLARLDGQSTTGGAQWYSTAQAWAVASDMSDGRDPTGNVTREQLAVQLYRYAGSPAAGGGTGTFQDADQVSSWAQDAMTWCIANGILQGANGKLNPGQDATRAEVSTMLMRFVEHLSK